MLGEPKNYLSSSVRVERLPAESLLRPAAPPRTENAVQDDYPAFWVRYQTGKQYLAWVAYQKEKDRVLLVERDGPEGKWSEPIEVDGPGDQFRVALAGTHGDTLWIVWSSQRDHHWNLYARPYTNGKLGEEVRLTDAAGPNIWHRMTTDQRGRAWLVWQGFRDGQADIFARCADGDGWHEPVKVSTAKPTIGTRTSPRTPKEDRVWVGWDTYDKGSYGVRIRSLSGGPKAGAGRRAEAGRVALVSAPTPAWPVTASGHLWVAWDESGSQWGKDTGFLYPHTGATRFIVPLASGSSVCVDGKWQEPAADFAAFLPPDMKEFIELPQLQDRRRRDGCGWRSAIALLPPARGRLGRAGRWDVYATAYLGDRWLAPIELPHSGGRNDHAYHLPA